MRKLAVLLLCAVLTAGSGCGGASPAPKPVDPKAAVDPQKSYTVVYWDAEPPSVLDPQGVYRPAVEKLIEEFCLLNPNIAVEVQWLNWSKAEPQLSRALRDGIPPDIWADWQGLARRDHVLQVPAGIWLDPAALTPAGKRVSSHQGQVWAWPRWFWPQGLLTLRSHLEEDDAQLAELVSARWTWEEFGVWLEEGGLHLMANDWEAGFTSQALVAATGRGAGQWGGQELNQLMAVLAALKKEGVISGDSAYRKITGGKNIIGGAAPALLTWLGENLPGAEAVLLPMPGVEKVTAIPVRATSLLQFRQIEYKGDDHTRAAALLGEFLAARQGEIAAALWAAPAWAGEWNPENLPAWYVTILQDARVSGVPLVKVDVLDRAAEDEFRAGASRVLADFWAGKADALEAAEGLAELQ